MFFGYNQYWPDEFMVFVVYVQKHPKAQPTVVLVLKHLRRRGFSLKVSSYRLGEVGEKPGIEPATPGLQYIIANIEPMPSTST